MVGKVTEPEKELRFTRAGQAMGFVVFALFCFCVAGAVLLLGTSWITEWPEPYLGSAWPAVVPLVLGLGSGWLAVHLTRHAYLLLTPVGIEVFPFFFPARGFRMWTWGEVESIGVDRGRCELRVALAGGGGVVCTLRPLARRQRALLEEAVRGIEAKRRGGGAGAVDVLEGGV